MIFEFDVLIQDKRQHEPIPNQETTQMVKKPSNFQVARLEMRMRPAYRKDGNWGEWRKCPENRYKKILELQQHPDGHYMEQSWHYDLRVLWVDENNPRG